MSALLGALRANSAYAYMIVGVFWLAVAVLAASVFILWPVLACLLGGIQLRIWPARRLTWAWAVATAVFGFVLAAYQVYAWLPFLGGTFSSLAATVTGVFAVLALLHILLIYAGAKPAAPKTGPG